MVKMLIVDDEQISCSLIHGIIREYFPQIGIIIEAHNGKTAVEKAEELQPDVVIMDIEMPIYNGIDAARRIRQMLPSCAIVFLTAFAEFHYARQAVAIQVEDYLLKPIDARELVQVVTKIIGRKEAEEGWKGKKLCVGSGRSIDIAQKGKRYIDEHYMNELTVEQLAEDSHVSANYFNRIFKQHYQVSCKEYLTNVRIERAKEFLKNPVFTVREVGCMTGYLDSNYFTKVFRKNVGMTPKEYRNQALFLPED